MRCVAFDQGENYIFKREFKREFQYSISDISCYSESPTIEHKCIFFIMAQKLIVVVGATGGQGGSVIASFLKDGNWKIRGLTRNPESEGAKALSAKGVEMVKGDLGDLASLERAFSGANVIFAITDYYENFWTEGWQKSMDIEYTQGTNMAKAASKVATLEHYLWSTLPHSTRITEGKSIVPHFEAKGRVDEFIKADEHLLSLTTFCFFTTFVINLISYEVFKPIYLV